MVALLANIYVAILTDSVMSQTIDSHYEFGENTIVFFPEFMMAALLLWAVPPNQAKKNTLLFHYSYIWGQSKIAWIWLRLSGRERIKSLSQSLVVERVFFFKLRPLIRDDVIYHINLAPRKTSLWHFLFWLPTPSGKRHERINIFVRFLAILGMKWYEYIQNKL